MNTGTSILMAFIFILIILFSLTIHELGHFFMAKIFKVNIKELSIGIGPKLYSRIGKNNIRYSIRLLPLLAYVALDSKALRNTYKDDPEDKNYEWIMAPLPKGLTLLDDAKPLGYYLIMFGGIIVNLAAFIIFYILFVIVTILMTSNTPNDAANWFVTINNPFVQLGNSFKQIGLAMAFSQDASGGMFGVQIPQGNVGVEYWVTIILNYAVMINLLNATFNLLPIPPLDGYKAVSYSINHYSKFKIKDNVELWLNAIGSLIIFYIFISNIIVQFI